MNKFFLLLGFVSSFSLWAGGSYEALPRDIESVKNFLVQQGFKNLGAQHFRMSVKNPLIVFRDAQPEITGDLSYLKISFTEDGKLDDIQFVEKFKKVEGVELKKDAEGNRLDQMIQFHFDEGSLNRLVYEPRPHFSKMELYPRDLDEQELFLAGSKGYKQKDQALLRLWGHAGAYEMYEKYTSSFFVRYPELIQFFPISNPYAPGGVFFQAPKEKSAPSFIVGEASEEQGPVKEIHQ